MRHERVMRATAHLVLAIACAVCAHYAHDRAYDNALSCALFGSLFMDIVHEHCSWTLLKKVQKLPPGFGASQNPGRWINVDSILNVKSYR